MKSANQVISRLQQQRSRIHGMLSLGSHRDSGESSSAPLSPVSPDFAGRKFKLAAKRMRVLDPERLGQIHPEELTSLSTNVLEKYQDLKRFVHINPNITRDVSAWPAVETVHPGGGSRFSQPEPAAEANVLRQGSIIQKMSTVPKPGQSLESFKHQVQSQQKPRSTRPTAAQRPVIDANTRLYSRVQEITPQQKTQPTEIPMAAESQIEVDKSGTPDISTPVESKPSPIQRQLDEASPKEKLEQTVKPSQEGELPTKEAPGPARAQAPVEDVSTIAQSRASAEESPKLAEAKPTAAEVPAPDEPQTQDYPRVDMPIKKALPIRSSKKAAEKRPEPAKPVARQKMTPTLEQKASAKVSPVSTPISSPTVQSQPIAEESAGAPRSASLVRSDDQPLQEQSRPSVADIPSQEKPDVPMPPAEPEVELPLTQLASYRKETSKAIRAVTPQSFKPMLKPALINKVDTPLVSQRQQPTEMPSVPKADMPAFSQGAPALMAADPNYGGAQKLSLDLPKPAIRSAIGHPPAITAVAASPSPIASPQPAVAVQSPVSQQPLRISSMKKTANVVQRMWEGHSGPEASHSAASSSGEYKEGSNEAAAALDMRALAEDVFPYVKRLLEVEANRSSGSISGK